MNLPWSMTGWALWWTPLMQWTPFTQISNPRPYFPLRLDSLCDLNTAPHLMHERNPDPIYRTEYCYALIISLPPKLSYLFFCSFTVRTEPGSNPGNPVGEKTVVWRAQFYIEAKYKYKPPHFPKLVYFPTKQYLATAMWEACPPPTPTGVWWGRKTGGAVQRRQAEPRSRWQLLPSLGCGWQVSQPTQDQALGRGVYPFGFPGPH